MPVLIDSSPPDEMRDRQYSAWLELSHLLHHEAAKHVADVVGRRQR
jgi:hypothetical protein